MFQHGFSLLIHILLSYHAVRNFNTLPVLSIGCGNAVDYWSLVQVAEEKRLTSRIEYTGVDKVIWTYSFQERTKDKLVVKHDEICDYLTEIAAINYNYIIFPKSICEFSDEDFARILSFFRSVKIENPRICILTSFRATPNSCALDQNRFFRVIDSIRKNRNDEFKSIGKEYTIYKGDEEKIEKRDTSFKYPHIAQITLGTLHEYCGGFINKGVTCMDCKPLLDRYPLKCTKDVYYGIALLEKGSKD